MLWELKKPFSIEEVEVAPPKAHEVRIKVKIFFHFYLILGLNFSECNNESNQSTYNILIQIVELHLLSKEAVNQNC